MLTIGTSLVDISPKPGVQMAGYPHCPRENIGIHDPLYAAALYIDNGKEHIVMVTLDILYFSKKFVRTVRSKFPGKNIMFTTTHTHCGPWAYDPIPSELEEGIHDDAEYNEFIVEALSRCINEALTNTFKGSVGTYIGHCGAEQGVGGNRRDKNGPCDPTVNVIAAKDENGDVRACLLSYALHPTYLHDDCMYVSADYPGYIRRYLKYAAPKAVFLFAQGTSGNQSSRYYRDAQNFEEACRVGTTLGVEVHRCLNEMSFKDDIEIKVASEEIDLPFKKYPPLDVAKKNRDDARAAFAAMDDSDYTRKWNCELVMFGAELNYEYALLESKGELVDPDLPYEIETVMLDDTAVVGIQGEIFVEFGLEIKKNSPFEKTFVFELTNGILNGYLYTPDAVNDGGYEVGNSIYSEEAGGVIVEKATEMLKRL